jgi:5S rRNA maturation endonuclease (ribonuclease M5)
MGLAMKDLFYEKKSTSKKEIEKVYDYVSADGALLHQTVRYKNPKTFTQRRPDPGNAGKWLYDLKGIKTVIYKLPQVIEAISEKKPVFIVEGEKDADNLAKLGFTATTSPMGAGKWKDSYSDFLKGAVVYVIPDNDKSGKEHCIKLYRSLTGKAEAIKLIDLKSDLQELPDKGDVTDYFKILGAKDGLIRFQQLIDTAPDFEDVPPTEQETEKPEEKEVKPSQAEILLKFVSKTGAYFFLDEISDLYAAIPVEEHTEILSLESRDFSRWLQGLYFKHTQKPLSGDALIQATGVICAKARFESGEPKKLNVRAANYGGAFWYDLTNSEWEAVRITPDGWQFVKNPPIIFTRYRHQVEQIRPKTSGRADKILKYINLKDSSILFLCWLISCFIPSIPHVMPIFHGEKGAAKSTACEILKTLIDPSALCTLTLQNDLRTLAVNLQQHHFLPFDNVSYINDETSDILCRAITGSGIQQRKLNTNGDDYIFKFQRCIALNGINNAATRADLLDRSILIELERIAETDRRELSQVMQDFEADRAEILGGIFGIVAEAMKIYPSVKLDKMPRMADFTRWGYAIGEALGGFGQSFLDEYAANRAIQNQEAINSDPVATLIVEFMRGRENWSGSASNLYSELTHEASKHSINTRSKSFPPDPARLSKRLNGIKSNLEGAGITFERSHSTDRNIQLNKKLK